MHNIDQTKFGDLDNATLLRLLGLKINQDGEPEQITQAGGVPLSIRYTDDPVFDLCQRIDKLSPEARALLRKLIGATDPSVYFPN